MKGREALVPMAAGWGEKWEGLVQSYLKALVVALAQPSAEAPCPG